MSLSLVALDTETATLSAPPHLLEVAAVRIDGLVDGLVDGLEASAHFDALVRPPVPIEGEATRIHGLVEADVRDARLAPEVLAELFEFLGEDSILLAHDARKDAHVLGFECARHGLQPPPLRFLDTLALARKAFPEAPDYRLVTLVEYLELDVPQLHRALPDAVACWQVFAAALERLGGDEPLTEARLFRLAGVPVTLANALPLRPSRKPSIVRTLERARTEEQAVVLTYGAEGESPSQLEVRPSLVYKGRDRSYLEGECLSSGTLKTYRLDRIHRVRASS